MKEAEQSNINEYLLKQKISEFIGISEEKL